MNASTTTVLFQHETVTAQMIVEPRSPRFELVVAGEVVTTTPATRRWQSEAKAAIEGARDSRMASRLHTVTNSSFIAALGYSRSRQELTVVYKSGQVFIYNAVTMAEFKKLRHAHSVGKAYHAIIRGKKSGFEIAQAA